MLTRIYKDKRVFLTGHTGFKGSWLAEWLLSLGAEVHGYALDPQPHERLFGQLGLAGRLASDTRADLANRELLTGKLLEIQPDFVFHLAAQPLVRLSYDIPVETFAANLMGTVHVLDALRVFQAQNRKHKTSSGQCVAVMITTDKCYENREWLHAYREEDAMGGYDPYSASKGCAEIAIAAYRRSYFGTSAESLRIHLASARAGNVIGGGDWAKDRIIPDCIRAIREGQSILVRNKVATRPWQHVLEPLSGYLWLGACMAQASQHGEIGKQEAETEDTETCAEPSSFHISAFNSQHFCGPFNFGPALSSNQTVADLVQEFIRHAGGTWVDASDPHAPHEASKLNLATDKAFHLLNWQPVWDFQTTLEKTAAWYVREGKGDDPHALTIAQIAEYTKAAAAKGIPWAG